MIHSMTGFASNQIIISREGKQSIISAQLKSLNSRFFELTCKLPPVLQYLETTLLKKIKEKDIFLGEMILCFSDISDYAKKNKRSVKKELAEVAIHGFLHLSGLDHGKEMFQLQKETLERFF